MACLCEKIAGEDLELSPICIGDLWIFEKLDRKEIEAISREAIRKKTIEGQTLFLVVSTIMCEIILCHIFHKWQVGGNFTYGFRPPVDFHL